MTLKVSMESLAVCFLYSVVFGILSGALYNVLKIVKIALGADNSKREKHFSVFYSKGVKHVLKSGGGKLYSHTVTFFTDIVFFFIEGCLFSLFLYVFNYGIFRWFLLAGAVLGFGIYHATVGKAVVKAANLSADFVTLIFDVILSAVFSVLKAAFKILVKKPFVNFLLPFAQKIASAIDRALFKRYTLRCIGKIHEIVKFK